RSVRVEGGLERAQLDREPVGLLAAVGRQVVPGGQRGERPRVARTEGAGDLLDQRRLVAVVVVVGAHASSEARSTPARRRHSTSSLRARVKFYRNLFFDMPSRSASVASGTPP